MLRSISGLLWARSPVAAYRRFTSAKPQQLVLPIFSLEPVAHPKVRQDPVLRVMLMQKPWAEKPPDASRPLQAMNRNNRKGRRANKGARPNSRVSRRAKKRSFGNWRR